MIRQLFFSRVKKFGYNYKQISEISEYAHYLLVHNIISTLYRCEEVVNNFYKLNTPLPEINKFNQSVLHFLNVSTHILNVFE
jgi:hypothetical protein